MNFKPAPIPSTYNHPRGHTATHNITHNVQDPHKQILYQFQTTMHVKFGESLNKHARGFGMGSKDKEIMAKESKSKNPQAENLFSRGCSKNMEVMFDFDCNSYWSKTITSIKYFRI